MPGVQFIVNFKKGKYTKNGADEVDMMINLTDVKDGYLDAVEDEIRAVKAVVGDKILKVVMYVQLMRLLWKLKTY